MIRRIRDLPDNVIGIEVIGQVGVDDYREALDPLVDAAAAGGDKLRLLAVIGPGFTGATAGALWEDAKLGIRSWSAWERIAVVTDRESLVEAVHLLGWMVPGEIRTFSIDDIGQATDWLTT